MQLSLPECSWIAVARLHSCAMASIQIQQYMNIILKGPDGKTIATFCVSGSELETIDGKQFVSLRKKNRSLKKLLQSKEAPYLDFLRSLRTAKTNDILTQLQQSEGDGAEALFGPKVEGPLKEHAKKKRLAHGGSMPATVSITLPGYKDIASGDEKPPMEAQVKASMDHREVVAMRADPDVFLHLAHDAAAAASESSQRQPKLVSFRADRHIVVARSPATGSSKVFSVPRSASEEDIELIMQEAERWLGNVDKPNEDEQDVDEQQDEGGDHADKHNEEEQDEEEQQDECDE